MSLINKLKLALMRGGMSLKSVENDSLGASHIESEGHNITITNEAGGAYTDMLKGVESEAVKEIRARFYKVTREMDEMRVVKSSEGGLVIEKKDHKQRLSGLRSDGFEKEYERFLAVENEFVKSTLYEEINGLTTRNHNSSKIEMSYNYRPKYDLPLLISNVFVGKDSDGKRLMELWFNEDPGLKRNGTGNLSKNDIVLGKIYVDVRTLNQQGLKTLFEFNEIAFTTSSKDFGDKSFMSYLYKYQDIKRINIHGRHLVVKYYVEPVLESFDSIAKYQNDDVDSAYAENKRRPI